jgi:hypothetical protein
MLRGTRDGVAFALLFAAVQVRRALLQGELLQTVPSS